MAKQKMDEGPMSGLVEGMQPQAAAVEVFDPAVVIENIPAFDGESEEALALRFGRKPRKAPALTFEFTRDPALLHQYFRLYESECRVVDIPEFRRAEEEYNKRGYFLVVRQGNHCVGGARISVSSPRHPMKLPMEIGSFRLSQVFAELKTREMTYAELSRLVLLPEFRNGVVTREMFYHFYRKSLALGVQMMFAACPISNARMYRVNCKAVGLEQTLIHTGVELPPYPTFEEVKDYLISAVIEKNPVGDAFEPSYLVEYESENV